MSLKCSMLAVHWLLSPNQLLSKRLVKPKLLDSRWLTSTASLSMTRKLDIYDKQCVEVWLKPSTSFLIVLQVHSLFFPFFVSRVYKTCVNACCVAKYEGWFAACVSFVLTRATKHRNRRWTKQILSFKSIIYGVLKEACWMEHWMEYKWAKYDNLYGMNIFTMWWNSYFHAAYDYAFVISQ